MVVLHTLKPGHWVTHYEKYEIIVYQKKATVFLGVFMRGEGSIHD